MFCLKGPILDVFVAIRVNEAFFRTWNGETWKTMGILHEKIGDFLLVDVTIVSSNIQT